LLLVNNIVFLVATLTVLFGTLFPLLRDALGMGKYSVGPPYFNAVFVPLMAILVPFMGIGAISRWKKDTAARWQAELLVPTVVAVLCGFTLPLLLDVDYNIWVALAVVLAAWLFIGLCKDLWFRAGSAGFIKGVRRLTPSYWGMFLAHSGMAVSILGVVVATQYSAERDLKMMPGDSETVAGYEFQFVEKTAVSGPNFIADEIQIDVKRDGQLVATMRPQKRRYLAQGNVMTEAAIDAGLFRDLYVAMGDPVGDEGAWAIRLHYKPMVRWIWLGPIFMAFGAFVTLLDKRYRSRRVASTSRNVSPAGAEVASA
jgi:cytochrome c-type biogenesis protein CcmF